MSFHFKKILLANQTKWTKLPKFLNYLLINVDISKNKKKQRFECEILTFILGYIIKPLLSISPPKMKLHKDDPNPKPRQQPRLKKLLAKKRTYIKVSDTPFSARLNYDQKIKKAQNLKQYVGRLFEKMMAYTGDIAELNHILALRIASAEEEIDGSLPFSGYPYFHHT